MADGTTANYTHVQSYPNGFFVVDKGAIDDDTRARIESQGYMVIEKQPGRTVDVLHAPRQQVQYYPQYVGQGQAGYPYQQPYSGFAQAYQNAQGAA